MGSGNSMPYSSVEEALADGKTQEEIDNYIKELGEEKAKKIVKKNKKKEKKAAKKASKKQAKLEKKAARKAKKAAGGSSSSTSSSDVDSDEKVEPTGKQKRKMDELAEFIKGPMHFQGVVDKANFDFRTVWHKEALFVRPSGNPLTAEMYHQVEHTRHNSTVLLFYYCNLP